MILIDGRKIKDEILEEVKRDIMSLSFTPVFCDILVGNDISSLQYVNMKAKIAESVGIKFRTANFDIKTTTEELIMQIKDLNQVPHMCGIIIQLPLPRHIDKRKVLDAILPELDVDCLGSVNSQNFYSSEYNKENISYPTGLACVEILERLNIDLSKKEILILGQGTLVGLPVSHLLEIRGLKIKRVNSKTKDIDILMKNADIIVSAIGQGKYIKGHMIKKGSIIIDAGTSEDNGAIVGDVDLESVSDIASIVSPTPGGVGPITVAMLLKNILQVAKRKLGSSD
jgi:5,10-methylene-tetrahydrofolate dehydrogenase/methenyl tetrahydrofolate cyclohydrolase